MTYVEQLHGAIDRIAEADARASAARADRLAAVEDLHQLLNEQPERGLEDGHAAKTDTIPAPASIQLLACPDCDFQARGASGLAVHRRKRHAVVGERTLQGGTEVVELEPVSDEPPTADGWPCTEKGCLYVGPRPQALGAHRFRAHGIKSQSQDPSGRYLCPKGCGRDFAHRQNAERHGKNCRRAHRKGAVVPVDRVHVVERSAIESPTAEAHGLIEARPAPWIPKPEGTGLNGSPIIHGGKERWLCNRCPAFFPTEESRDRHQATHAPVPDAPPLRRSGEGYSSGRGGE